MSVSVRDALRMAALYVVLSILWLVLAQVLLQGMTDDPLALTVGQQINVVIWVMFSAVLIFVSRARLLNFIGIGVRLRGEDRERLRMAAAVFDSTLEGVLVTDRQGLIVHVNRAFMRITGYQQDEVVGQRPNKFKSGRHGVAFYQQIFATLAEKGEWSGEIWNRRKSGESIPSKSWPTWRITTR